MLNRRKLFVGLTSLPALAIAGTALASEPERKIFYVDTGKLSPEEAKEVVQKFEMEVHNKQAIHKFEKITGKKFSLDDYEFVRPSSRI